MQKPPHLTRTVAGGAQAEKRLSEAQRRSGGGGSRIQKARKEHKFKAVQKDKTAESMSLFLGVPAHLTRAEPSFKQSWSCKGCEFLKETGICVNEQFTTCIFNALSRSHQNPVSPWEKKTLQAFRCRFRAGSCHCKGHLCNQSHGCLFRDRFHCSARRHQTGIFGGEGDGELCAPV